MKLKWNTIEEPANLSKKDISNQKRELLFYSGLLVFIGLLSVLIVNSGINMGSFQADIEQADNFIEDELFGGEDFEEDDMGDDSFDIDLGEEDTFDDLDSEEEFDVDLVDEVSEDDNDSYSEDELSAAYDRYNSYSELFGNSDNDQDAGNDGFEDFGSQEDDLFGSDTDNQFETSGSIFNEQSTGGFGDFNDNFYDNSDQEHEFRVNIHTVDQYTLQNIIQINEQKYAQFRPVQMQDNETLHGSPESDVYSRNNPDFGITVEIQSDDGPTTTTNTPSDTMDNSSVAGSKTKQSTPRINMEQFGANINSIEGVLFNNHGNIKYFMQIDTGKKLYLDTQRDLRGAVGKRINLNYSGTLDKFVIRSITIPGSQSLSATGPAANTLLLLVGILGSILTMYYSKRKTSLL